MRLQGSSRACRDRHYMDGALQHKYKGLHLMRLALSRDLVLALIPEA